MKTFFIIFIIFFTCFIINCLLYYYYDRKYVNGGNLFVWLGMFCLGIWFWDAIIWLAYAVIIWGQSIGI